MDQRKLLLLLAALSLIALFGAVQRIELRAEEPRRAVVSMEMEMTGEYVVPHINGKPYYNKPPVFNWIMAAGFKLFGSYSEWVVRLAGLLSIIILAFLSFRLARSALGINKAIFAGIFVLCGADILFYGSINSGEIDLFYALLCFVQIALIYYYFKRSQWWHLFLITYIIAALGFLTKGMPSLAFQAITLLAWFSYKRSFSKLISIQHFCGILVMLAVGGAYFWLYDQKADAQAFLIRQFKEASQRTAAESPFLAIAQQFFSFPLQFLLLLLPWSLFVIPWFSKGAGKEIKQNDLLTFSLVFILSNILLYWFAGEFKARYYYMFFPFVAYILSAKSDQLLKLRAWQLVFRILGSLLAIFSLISLFIGFESWNLTALLSLAILVVLLAFFTFLLWQSKMFIWSMAGLMLLTRIAFNLGILEATQRDSENFYRQPIVEMMAVCDNAPIMLYGDAHEFMSDASIGPLTVDTAHLRTAPLIAYQIPYYVSKASGKVMKFEEEFAESGYYLVPEDKLPQGSSSLFMLRDHWQQKNYHLILLP